MEHRPSDNEEQDSDLESKKDSKSKKKRSSRLGAYLAGIRSKEPLAESSLEPTPSEDKPRRMERLMSRLFPRIVETSPDPGQPPQPEYPINHDAWRSAIGFSLGSQVERPGESRDTAADVDGPQAVELAPVATGQVEHSPEAVEEDDVDAPAVPEDQAEAPVATTGGGGDRVPPLPPLPDSVPVPEGPTPDNGGDYPPVPLPVPMPVPLAAPEAGRGAATTTTVIERRGSNVLPIALVGAEYIARKRADKKLEKRVNTKIEALDKKVGRERTQSVPTAVERPHTVRERQALAERPNFDKKPETAELRRKVETIEQKIAEKRHAPEQSPAPNVIEYAKELEERAVTTERSLDRRHEVKDEPGGGPATGAAAPIGAVLQQSSAGKITTTGVQRQASSDTGSLPFVTEEAANDYYRRAAQRGFWSAICIITLGLLAYLVVK